MNFCPPNPGSTVMISTISTRSTNGSTDSTGVFGFTPTPTFIPAFFICWISSRGLSDWSKNNERQAKVLFVVQLIIKTLSEKRFFYDSENYEQNLVQSSHHPIMSWSWLSLYPGLIYNSLCFLWMFFLWNMYRTLQLDLLPKVGSMTTLCLF